MLTLLAASGDLRNVLKTVVSIPQSYDRPITLVVNDMDMDVVARNLIILLIALVTEDEAEAAECMIHLWYSALVRPSDIDILTTRIRPLIEDVIANIGAIHQGRYWGRGGNSAIAACA